MCKDFVKRDFPQRRSIGKLNPPRGAPQRSPRCLPGMGHCTQPTAGPSAIGGGANEPPDAYRSSDHHAVSAAIKWVEQGVAPDRIIASRFDASGKALRQRPVCAFPAEARYKGSGDADDAASFTCVIPNAADRPLDATDLILIQSSLRQREMKLPNR